VNPCTKGLWIYPKPLQTTTSDGSPLNILVVDSEGLAAATADSPRHKSNDVQIFTLCLLLASYFVYNQIGPIDEQAITRFGYVANLCQKIHLQEFPTSEGIMPQFCWVLRDFALKLADENGQVISARTYLE
jgi:hypothetical protein